MCVFFDTNRVRIEHRVVFFRWLLAAKPQAKPQAARLALRLRLVRVSPSNKPTRATMGSQNRKPPKRTDGPNTPKCIALDMETRTKTCGPYPGGLILTQIRPVSPAKSSGEIRSPSSDARKLGARRQHLSYTVRHQMIPPMGVGQQKGTQNGLPWQMERTESCGPYPGGLILTHTQIEPNWSILARKEVPKDISLSGAREGFRYVSPQKEPGGSNRNWALPEKKSRNKAELCTGLEAQLQRKATQLSHAGLAGFPQKVCPIGWCPLNQSHLLKTRYQTGRNPGTMLQELRRRSAIYGEYPLLTFIYPNRC